MGLSTLLVQGNSSWIAVMKLVDIGSVPRTGRALLIHFDRSTRTKVVERALFMWNNHHIIYLMAQDRQGIMPIIVPALEQNSQNHWNQTNVMKMFSEMDEELFSACLTKCKKDKENEVSLEEKRRLTWAKLESAAALQPVTGHTAVLVGRHPYLAYVQWRWCKRCSLLFVPKE